LKYSLASLFVPLTIIATAFFGWLVEARAKAFFVVPISFEILKRQLIKFYKNMIILKNYLLVRSATFFRFRRFACAIA
jgi:hypothetical protein